MMDDEKEGMKLATPRTKMGCNDACRNPTLAKCEDETHTPKVGDLESSGT
jgi:hypothetical protein